MGVGSTILTIMMSDRARLLNMGRLDPSFVHFLSGEPKHCLLVCTCISTPYKSFAPDFIQTVQQCGPSAEQKAHAHTESQRYNRI